MKLEKIFISTSRLKFFQPNNPKERGHLFPVCLSKSSRLLISPAWEVTCPFLNPILWPGIWIVPSGHDWTTCLPPGQSDGLRTSKLGDLENLTKESEWATSRSQRHEFQVDDEKKKVVTDLCPDITPVSASYSVLKYRDKAGILSLHLKSTFLIKRNPDIFSLQSLWEVRSCGKGFS